MTKICTKCGRDKAFCYWNEENQMGSPKGCRETELEIEVASLWAFAKKINRIRNDIIKHQNVNWSRDIYPLVAALDEIGLGDNK